MSGSTDLHSHHESRAVNNLQPNKLSSENQKAVNAIQQYSAENQKGAITIGVVQ